VRPAAPSRAQGGAGANQGRVPAGGFTDGCELANPRAAWRRTVGRVSGMAIRAGCPLLALSLPPTGRANAPTERRRAMEPVLVQQLLTVAQRTLVPNGSPAAAVHAMLRSWTTVVPHEGEEGAGLSGQQRERQPTDPGTVRGTRGRIASGVGEATYHPDPQGLIVIRLLSAMFPAFARG
jgi:hypothetical protein